MCVPVAIGQPEVTASYIRKLKDEIGGEMRKMNDPVKKDPRKTGGDRRIATSITHVRGNKWALLFIPTYNRLLRRPRALLA